MQNTHHDGLEVRKTLTTTQKFADERIHELACEALFRCQDIDSTSIEISVENGIVYLSGSVRDSSAMKFAESCIKNIADVRGIENDLQLISHPKANLS